MASVLPRDLGDGLVLRHAIVADAERLAAFNAEVHRPPQNPEPDHRIGTWTSDLMTKPPPGFAVSDITIIEDRISGEIVSSLNLISQIWSYGGVHFGVGRPELVGTDPRYRRRGLVRIQMDLIHEWSAERGQSVQAITGIPYFYRQFGYEMALALGGGRTFHRAMVPALRPGESERFRVRGAEEDDVPFIARTYSVAERRQVVSCVRDEANWRYELVGRSEGSDPGRSFVVIEDAAGESVGFLAYVPFLVQSGDVIVNCIELQEGTSWLAVMPCVLRYLEGVGTTLVAHTPSPGFVGIAFGLGESHPCYQVLGERFIRVGNPYAWYIRVPDIAGFLATVSPALERRLAESVLPGHSGDLKISFYDSGVRIRMERGRLTGVEPWQPSRADPGDLGFPGLVFFQLLFGNRSLADLEYAYADCRVSSWEARVVANALFPKGTSDVWPIA